MGPVMDLETPLEYCSLRYFSLRLLLSEFLGNGSCSLLELAADAFNAGNSAPVTPCYCCCTTRGVCDCCFPYPLTFSLFECGVKHGRLKCLHC